MYKERLNNERVRERCFPCELPCEEWRPGSNISKGVGSYSISFLVKDGDPDLTLVREWVAIQ